MKVRRIFARQLATGVSAAIVLIFLFANARYVEPVRHNRIVANLNEIDRLDAALSAAALKARYGLVVSSEPLTPTLDRIILRWRELERGEYAIAGKGDGAIDREMAAFALTLGQKRALIERFESASSQFRGSYAALELAVAQAVAADPPAALRASLQSILYEASVLRGASNDEDRVRVQRLVDGFPALDAGRAAARAPLAAAMLRARDFVADHRELEDLTSRLTSGDAGLQPAAIAARYHDFAEAGHRRADKCRFLLFLASLGLLTYAGYSYWRLREGAGRLHKALEMTESQKVALDVHAQQLRVAANALENTVEGIMITDADRRIVSVNKSFTDITGYTAEEAMGRPALFLRADDDEAFYAEVWDSVHKTGRWRGEVKRRRKDGQVYPQFNSISAVRNPGGATTHYVTVFSDISLDKKNSARLEFLAHYDALTHLPNRALFQDRLREALYRARRYGNPAALMFIDLDHFKSINDTLGHDVGDLLLQATARRLEECVRETDTVARLGGDEFTILLHELKEGPDAVTVAGKLLASLAQPFLLAGRELFVSASIGITCYPDDGEDAQVLLANADAAMYRAKQRGRNTYQFFAADMNADAAGNLVLANELRTGLEQGQLMLHYEPRIAHASGKITAVEALVRWQHPRLGVVAPARFMPVAEQTGLTEAIGEWVIEKACAQMREWQARGLAPARVAVNLTARQFAQPDLPQRIVACVARNGIDATRLEVEITEGMAMQDPHRTRETLVKLRALGIAASIDDFGTGHSSLGHLERLPIDYLKIDKSFVREIARDPAEAAIARTIIAMARSMKLQAIATGVQTEEQCQFLRREGCEEMQGPLFGKPCAPDELERLLAACANDESALAQSNPPPPQRISNAAATLLPSAVRML